MQSGIDIYILDLAVILDKSGPKKLLTECKIEPWTYQEKIGIIVGFGKSDSVELEIQTGKAQRLISPLNAPLQVDSRSIEIFAGSSTKIERNDFSFVRIISRYDQIIGVFGIGR